MNTLYGAGEPSVSVPFPCTPVNCPLPCSGDYVKKCVIEPGSYGKKGPHRENLVFAAGLTFHEAGMLFLLTGQEPL